MRNYVKRVSQKTDKLSKEQIVSLLEDLLDENNNLYSVLESISTGLLILDNDFYYTQSNQLADSLLNINYSFDDNNISTLPIWEVINDEDICSFFKKSYEKSITNASEEFSLTTFGGKVRFLALTMSPYVREASVKGRIILIRDITEKKSQDVLLHRMENMANLTNLAAGVAHDIKNPLGAISIHIQLVQKALTKARDNNSILPDKKYLEKHIDVVNEEIDHLNRLVMDFLFAVRPINANLELKNPAKLIENVINFIKPEFNQNNIGAFFINNCKENTKILIDEKLFRDLLMNFAQNSLAAIKSSFSEEQEHKEHKTSKKNQDNISLLLKQFSDEKENVDYKGLFIIECSTEDTKFVIRILDNGCGMDSKTVQKIFEPYFTTKSNGTGLGMTMVYKIIKEFNGEIHVDSKKKTGTIFKIKLPLPQKEKLAISN